MNILTKWLVTRERKKPCTTIVLHATAGSSLGGALSTLRLRGLSYHYLIEKNGEVTKCAPSSRVAFHAGKSEGPEGSNVNDYSIGISFVNLNDGKDPITYDQEQAAKLLVLDLENHFPLSWVTTHYAISPGRKTDPKPFNSARLTAFAKAVGLNAFY
jgi:N-acetylmuramoyl-L-alanine amidase